MSSGVHELVTATYGTESRDGRVTCANCDCCLRDRPAHTAVDAPGELFCRPCVTQCTTCKRFLHYTTNVPKSNWTHGRPVGTCGECGDAPVPIFVVQLQF